MTFTGTSDPGYSDDASADGASGTDVRLLPVLRHSIRGLPLRHGIEDWRHQLLDYSDNEALEPEPEDFYVETSSWHFGSLVLTDASVGAQRQVRSSQKIRSSQMDHYKVIYQLEGNLRLAVNGERLLLRPGQLAVVDMARPESYEADRGRKIVMFIARDTLDEALPAPLNLHGFMPSGALAGLFANHLHHLAENAGALPAASASGLAEATVRLMAAAISSDARRAQGAANALESTLLRQACRYVELHLTEADLGVERLCAFFKISRASLYRLFEPLGGVSRYVQERRLVRIHEQLTGAAGRVHLASLADTFGFRSASHFSQAFRRQFGYSPSDAHSRATTLVTPARPEPGNVPRLSEWVQRLRG